MPTNFEKLVTRAVKAAGVTKVAALLRAAAAEATQLSAAATLSSRRARTPSAAKAKGRAGVVEIRDWLLRAFPDLEPDDVLIQTTSVGGQDLHLSPRAQRVFPFAIESKNTELLNVWEALKQADINAQKKQLKPVVIFRRNGSPHYITFPLDVFTEVYLCPSTKPASI